MWWRQLSAQIYLPLLEKEKFFPMQYHAIFNILRQQNSWFRIKTVCRLTCIRLHINSFNTKLLFWILSGHFWLFNYKLISKSIVVINKIYINITNSADTNQSAHTGALWSGSILFENSSVHFNQVYSFDLSLTYQYQGLLTTHQIMIHMGM